MLTFWTLDTKLAAIVGELTLEAVLASAATLCAFGVVGAITVVNVTLVPVRLAAAAVDVTEVPLSQVPSELHKPKFIP